MTEQTGRQQRSLVFDRDGWGDYLYWQGQDRKTLRRVNALIQVILRDPFTGTGKPEPLKHILFGAWSRRIDDANRLVYLVTDSHVVILRARDHH